MLGKSTPVAYPHVVAWLKKYRTQLCNPKTLEAGAGAGQYASVFPPDRYASFDISTDWYETVRPPTVIASSDKLPFEKGSFDFAFSVAAFDYFADPAASLKELHRCLTKRGVFFLVTYDIRTLEKIHANALSRSDEKEHKNHHVYDEERLRVLSEKAGFSLKPLKLFPKFHWRRLSPLNFRWHYFRMYELTKTA